MKRNVVPCGSCRLCCTVFMVPIHPDRGDDPKQYQTAICFTPGKAPYMILDRHQNGNCVYLGDNGCTIHDRAPWVCRTFDCRELYKKSDRVGRRIAIKRGDVTKEIFDRGRELLDMLWIVLDPEPDIVIARDFVDHEEAVQWIAREIEMETEEERLVVLRRCVVAPFDPSRDAA